MATAAAARSDIAELIAEFAWRIEHNDGHGVEELFTADGTYDMAGWTLSGRDAIKQFYDDRRNRGPRTSRHLFTGLRFDPEPGADVASGVCVLTLHAHPDTPPLPIEPVLVADYADTYRQDVDGRWLFQTRTVTPLFLQMKDEGQTADGSN